MTDYTLMAEAAMLYYEKKMTQQEIADMLYLSRQTVSKLLHEAVEKRIVEITVHHPKKECDALARQIESVFGVSHAEVVGAGSRSEAVRRMMTVKAAAEYLTPLFLEGNQRIAVSWGRTVEQLIAALPELSSAGNLVFPLFGATDHGQSCFLSNELARSMADKIGASVRYAWFPYLPENETDLALLKETSYYQKMCRLWESVDLAVVGIGNREIVELFKDTFGQREEDGEAVGDIATHFFTKKGKLLQLYRHTLCASAENLRHAKKVVAIACGRDKTEAIEAALGTGLIHVLLCDEHTARELLALARA